MKKPMKNCGLDMKLPNLCNIVFCYQTDNFSFAFFIIILNEIQRYNAKK